MVDTEEGTDLKFVPTKLINGIKCAKIKKEDVMQEIEFWHNAILCSVLGANPPFEVMQGYLKCIWVTYEIDKIIQVGKGVFLVRFGNMQGKLTVKKRGIYFFDAKPLLVKVLVQLPDLDVKYWGLESLSKIDSILGIPIKTDRYTKGRLVIKYARLLIEMSLEAHFLITLNSSMTMKQKVRYEWLPLKCTHCHMFGHEETTCKKKGTIRKEWRKIQTEPKGGEGANQLEQHSTESEQPAYTPVSKRASVASYIFTIKDDQGNQVEGFEQVGHVMLDFYKGLLGKQMHLRYPIKFDVVEQGPVLNAEQ
ncbi:hypothetical protein Cgig2_031782 [Carnegiea gigantea]|uniref:DUF4283 domain-containing protein n=1 Tax=Carnegiea gigantea TaxID=171969 RepID=A0A9Q1GS30_9CARY|nr:hypothetical protein Cgig2_031782 [Carnegiea gigantea]